MEILPTFKKLILVIEIWSMHFNDNWKIIGDRISKKQIVSIIWIIIYAWIKKFSKSKKIQHYIFSQKSCSVRKKL